MKRIIKWLIVADVIMALICISFGEQLWLLSTQVAFWSSTLVLFASIQSYKKMVSSRLAAGAVVLDDERDEIDKMEDPYDLYGKDDELTSVESSITKSAITKSALDTKIAIKEEKEHMKKNRRSTLEVLKDSKTFISFYRLGAYLLLFLGFFYLNSNKLLHIPSYLIALSIPIVIIVALLISQDKEIYEEIN